ncbi:MAG: ATP-binding protein [Firmicutes bacterium]|nr:ATP-binding protein [Bacillota bacterium]
MDGKDFASCGKASEAVKRTLKQLAVAPEQLRRIGIAMYEGEVNMVIHAGGGLARVEIGADRVVVTLKDTGKGIPDIALAMQAGYSTADANIRAMGFGAGMGLPNMKKYSDAMRIESAAGVGTKVTLEFNI